MAGNPPVCWSFYTHFKKIMGDEGVADTLARVGLDSSHELVKASVEFREKAAIWGFKQAF